MDIDALMAATGIQISDIRPEPEEKPASIYEPIQPSQPEEDNKSMLFNNTAYIICEKKSFRSDAFVTMLAEEFKTDTIYTSSGNIPSVKDPLCFIVDVNGLFDDRTAQKILVYIQDVAYENNIHIFLIGEPEELQNSKEIVNRQGVAVTQFQRPLDMKQCVDEIKDVILSTPITKRKKHILATDDSQVFCTLLQKNLEQTYRITTCLSAYDTIAELTKIAPDVPDMLIIDQKMPIVDGITLVKLLKQRPELQDIPVIVYSGNDNVEDMIELMPIVDFYIPKTEPAVKINKYVEEVFKKKKKERKSKKEKNKKDKKKR